MAGRLWTALLVLAGVFAVHGVQCAAGDGGHDAAHAPAASIVVTAVSPGHADAAAAVTPLTDPAPGAHPTTTTTTAAADDRGTGAPHETPGHLWTVCLAVLAAALVLVAVLLPRPAQLTRPALTHVRARLGSLAPARPPDLSALCLLRI
jgi:hypothetical protein